MKETEAVTQIPQRRRDDSNAPSARQLAFIATLAQRVGKRVDVGSITSKEAASGTIAELLELGLQMGAGRMQSSPRAPPMSQGVDERERRIAFGMATKLVYSRHAERTDVGKTPEFWREVHQFYRAYQQEQERAVRSYPLVSSGGAA